MALRHVVLDFDGTCTQVEKTQARYLERYRELLEAEVGRDFASAWDEGWERVRTRSPEAAWTTLGRTPAAPANADPYIAAGEILGFLERRWRAGGKPLPPIPRDLYKRAYSDAEAPWRDEVVSVLAELADMGVRVTFVSNSATTTIAGRIDDLLRTRPRLRESIRVFGDANKYVVKELSWDGDGDMHPALREAFLALPAAASGVVGLRRPVYLRRGDYFHALAKVWDGDATAPADTLVCGDIYELDLAMPAALGAHVQLVLRAEPHATCAYEVDAVRALGERGTVAADLTALTYQVRAIDSRMANA